MATKQIIWTSSVCLPCACEVEPRVVLCITPEKSAVPPFGFLDAYLVSACRSRFRCKITYTFAYNDELIMEGETLTADDITGAFCKSCMTDWIEALVSMSFSS